MKNRILVLILGFTFCCCSSYFGKTDSGGRYRVNEKHWTLKNIPNENVKRVLETDALYKLEYTFSNDSFFFDDQTSGRYYDSNDSEYLRFFDTGHVFSNIPYKSNVHDGEIIGDKEEWTNLEYGNQGFYTMGSSEFEIEFFHRQNVSLFGSMDRYYYQALITNNVLHLVRKHPFQKNTYFHRIYKKVPIPTELITQKASW